MHEMGKILIFSELESMALDKSSKDAVLIGQKDQVEFGGERYNFISYGRPNIDFRRLNNLKLRPNKIIFPVVYSGQKPNDGEEIHRIITQYLQAESMVLAKEGELEFYEIQKERKGITNVIPLVKSYWRISKKEFFDSVRDLELEEEIKLQRKKIDNFFD